MAITFLSLDLLLAHPAVAEPLYVGDFDGPLERSAEQSPGLIRVDLSDGNPFAPQGELPGGFPSNMPRRAKAFLDFQKVEKTSKGQLFIRSADKKIFLLKLSEAQVKLFFGPPANVRPYEKLVKTAHLDQVFEYPCYCDSRINKLILGFEKQVVRRAVLVPPSSKAEE
jgi:hypothetical protein